MSTLAAIAAIVVGIVAIAILLALAGFLNDWTH